WRDRKLEDVAGLVPHATVVAGDDAEAIGARRQVAVWLLPPVAHVHPVAIPAIELYLEPVLLGDDETERGVVDLQIARQRRQPHAAIRSRGVCDPVSRDLFDVHGWRKLVERKMARIDHAQAVRRNKPQSPI